MSSCFIFKGTVSLSGKPGDEREVPILRDTGGSQSLIQASVLEFDEKSDCDASIIVRGVGMSFVPAPLHCIWVQSELAGFFQWLCSLVFQLMGWILQW